MVQAGAPTRPGYPRRSLPSGTGWSRGIRPAGGIYPGREVLTTRGSLTIYNSRHNKEGS